MRFYCSIAIYCHFQANSNSSDGIFSPQHPIINPNSFNLASCRSPNQSLAALAIPSNVRVQVLPRLYSQADSDMSKSILLAIYTYVGKFDPQLHPLTSQMMQQPGYSTPKAISMTSSSPTSGPAVGFNRTGSFNSIRRPVGSAREHKQRVLFILVLAPNQQPFSGYLAESISAILNQNEVSVTTTLSTKKHETGYRCINSYIVGKELGQGTSGEVRFYRYPSQVLVMRYLI